MKNYDDYIAQLPLGEHYIDKEVMMKHRDFISFDDSVTSNVAFFKINKTDACAVIINNKDLTLEENIQGYTLRMVYLFVSSHAQVNIPDTVWSIYGAENYSNSYTRPFDFKYGDESPYFKYIECDWHKNIYWLCSADGKDVIYGVCDGNIDAKLEGVETIHYLKQLHQGYAAAKVTSLTIPATVKKIKRIDGAFTDVTFQGVLPDFSENTFKNAEFGSVRVLTPFDKNSSKSRDILINGKMLGKPLKGNLLFAAHALTGITPKMKGYIALTNARFDCDGEIIYMNTDWIATICPRTYLRSDGEVKGSCVLIGLKESRQENGVVYDVYESPEIIEDKIVDAESRQ